MDVQEPLDGSQNWRRDEKGYLLQILNAKVYDVAVRERNSGNGAA